MSNIHALQAAAHVAGVNSSEESEVRKRISAAQESNSSDKAKKKEEEFLLEFLALPTPEMPPDHDVDYLGKLTEAYCAITSVTGAVTEDQLRQFDQLQQLDLTMSQIVLLNSKRAIEQEKNLLEAIKEAQAKQDEDNEINSIVSIVGYVFMGLSLLGGLGGMLGGMLATEAVASEEGVEMIAMKGADELGQGALGQNLAAEAEESVVARAAPEAESAGTPIKESFGTRFANSINEQVTQSFFYRAAETYGKFISKLLISTALSIPDIYDAVIKQQLGQIKQRLADFQRETGVQRGYVKSNQGYLEFFQKGVQRSSEAVGALGEELGEEVETATTTISTYGQIAQGIMQRRG